MIVATLRLQTSQENRTEVTQTFSSLSAPIQTEKGCRSCRVYREVGNDEAVVLIEEWETRDDWESHLQSNKFAVLLGAMSLIDDPSAVDFKVMAQIAGLESMKGMRGR
jgi:quinol monooxygenase YgiN